MGHFAGKSWTTYKEYLASCEPEDPVLFYAPSVVQAVARQFLEGFPGMVTYAVKANPSEEILVSLLEAGVRGFDCASVPEIDLIRRLAPEAEIHYNNPVRSRHEVLQAVQRRIRSFSVDSASELAKLVELVPDCDRGETEISVRFKIRVADNEQEAAAESRSYGYDFSAKFGATSDLAVDLLRQAAEAGFIASLTFHPGTQCTDPSVWVPYIRKAAEIASRSEVDISRLNVGGGFPNHRIGSVVPRLEDTFRLIERTVDEAFGSPGGGSGAGRRCRRPELVCEPGRAICGDAYTLAARVRAVRDGDHIFLNDGMYGSLFEFGLVGSIDRITVLSPKTCTERPGRRTPRIVFGPTCDSVDRVPGDVMVPCDVQEDDYFVIKGMGAYSVTVTSVFNGYGVLNRATVTSHFDDDC